MGYWKEKQIEQDELDAFCQYLYANDDVVHVVNYEDIPAVETERMYRDRFTNKFKAKTTGLDYLWDENTIVFAPDWRISNGDKGSKRSSIFRPIKIQLS